MDGAVRILLLAAMASLLLCANYWFVSSIYRAFVPHQFAIAPFRVVGRDNASVLGLALASQLHARLEELQTRFRFDRNRSVTPPSATTTGLMTAAITTLFISDRVVIPTALLEPIDLKVSVVGVEVGGILSWLQATLVPSATLNFTVSFDGERATISGDLGRFAMGGERSIYLETTGELREIVDTVAYALLRTKLAWSHAIPITALDLSDFRTLIDILTKVEELNLKIIQKHVVDADFADLLPRVEALLTKVPQWQELIFLAGSIAEGAGNQVAAKRYYDRLATIRETKSLTPSLATLLDKRPALTGVVASEIDQKMFIETMKRFAALMQLPGTDPVVKFKKLQIGTHGQWDDSTRSYEVNLDEINRPGLPQYVAIMGRFLEQHLERCKDTIQLDFWNAFRYALTDYLIKSVPEFGFKEEDFNMSRDVDLTKFLDGLQRRVGNRPVQRLALELLNNFDCDWNNQNLFDHILAIVGKRGLMSEVVVREVANEAPPRLSRSTSVH